MSRQGQRATSTAGGLWGPGGQGLEREFPSLHVLRGNQPRSLAGDRLILDWEGWAETPRSSRTPRDGPDAWRPGEGPGLPTSMQQTHETWGLPHTQPPLGRHPHWSTELWHPKCWPKDSRATLLQAKGGHPLGAPRTPTGLGHAEVRPEAQEGTPDQDLSPSLPGKPLPSSECTAHSVEVPTCHWQESPSTRRP